MPTLKQDYITIAANKEKYSSGVFNSLAKQQFDDFAPSSLGLGDVSRAGEYTQALAAIYDLEGFTLFCNQVDSHLVIPEFLQRYLDWFFEAMKDEFKESEVDSRVTIWGSLPFFVKFLGDGMLVLWDTAYTRGFGGTLNSIIRAHAIIERYLTEFIPMIRRHVYNPPPDYGVASRAAKLFQ
jgi:hypothetical protein